MLRTRVLSSILLVLLLFFVIYSHQLVLCVFIFLLSVRGIYEYYNAICAKGYRPIRAIGYFSCVLMLAIDINGVVGKVDSYAGLTASINFFSFFVFAMLLALFIFTIITNNKYNIVDISLTLFGVIYVPFLFSFIVLTRNLQNGLLLVLLIFIGAWSTDTFAYFFGRYAGRHRFLPISPNKTLEGCIGGIAGSMFLTFLYGIIIRKNNYLMNTEIYHFIIIGVLSGVISQIGDLSASAIKRYTGIKDYGKIMPGHGGVLDRFDSILFIAPVIYFYASFILMC